MRLDQIKEHIERIMSIFPNSFINRRFELIIEPKNNIYFKLDDVNTKAELDLKVIAWLSRPSCKGVSEYWQTKFRKGFNEYFDTEFTKDEMIKIYTKFGNGLNENLCCEFILKGLDLKILN